MVKFDLFNTADNEEETSDFGSSFGSSFGSVFGRQESGEIIKPRGSPTLGDYFIDVAFTVAAVVVPVTDKEPTPAAPVTVRDPSPAAPVTVRLPTRALLGA